jgi:hypothetical protein
MVLTVSFVLSPVTGLFVTVACSFHRQLDASVGASGPHDFAVRRTARSSAALPASTASRTDVRDDREAPLLIVHRTREEEPLICPSAQVHISHQG